MKTNQMMQVKIGNFGTIKIGHLDQIGDVSQVVEMGNESRKEKGLEPITLDSLLKKQSIWEFIISRNTQKTAFSNSSDSEELKVKSNYSLLSKFKTLKGEIQYSELMKKFPDLIKSKRGRYGGTWAELFILLKIASMLDKDLEVEIYRVFIEEKLLDWRDLGGDYFKEFNKIIDTLPDRKGEDNTNIYIDFALIIRDKLKIDKTRGYNLEQHNSKIQQKRTEYLSNLTSMIKVGLITNYEQLRDIFMKL
jgi:hypothetical protein